MDGNVDIDRLPNRQEGRGRLHHSTVMTPARGATRWFRLTLIFQLASELLYRFEREGAYQGASRGAKGAYTGGSERREANGGILATGGGYILLLKLAPVGNPWRMVVLRVAWREQLS